MVVDHKDYDENNLPVSETTNVWERR